MPWKSAWLITAAIAIAAMVGTDAHADDAAPGAAPNTAAPSKADIDQARELARTAFDQLDGQQYAEALDTIERAEKLYHAPIHMQVMGQALEGLGRRAQAAEVYDRLVAEPLPSSSPKVFRDAQEFAKERLKELAARLPLLLIKVRGAGTAQVTATVDGNPFTLTTTAVRLDAGERRVKLTAPGYADFEREVSLREGAGVVVLEAVMQPANGSDGETPSSTNELQVLPWVAFGVGGAGLIVGTITGALSLAKASDLDERCPERRCLPSDQPEHDSAVALGWTSTVMLGLGVAGAAAGAVLLVVDLGGEDEEAEAEAEAEPGQPRAQLRVGPGSLSLRYHF